MAAGGVGATNELTKQLRLGIDEGEGRSGKELSARTITDVVDEGLTIGRDEDCDGTVDAIGNNTFVQG